LDGQPPRSFVNPFIGVNDGPGASNNVIGPQVPFGSINPSPHSPRGSHDGYQPGEPVRGFGQLHATGTGWGEYGQILVSPQVGLEVDETRHDAYSGLIRSAVPAIRSLIPGTRSYRPGGRAAGPARRDGRYP
jgi:putative alpha-1,2-mannosidase